MVCVLDSLMRVSLMAPNPIISFDLTSAANIIAKEGFQDAKPSNLLVGLLQQKVSNLQIPDNLLEGFDDDDAPDFHLGALENIDSDKESMNDDDEGESMMLAADFLIEEEDAGGAESSDDDADLGPLMRLGAVMRDRAAGLAVPEPEPEDDLDDDASGFAAL